MADKIVRVDRGVKVKAEKSGQLYWDFVKKEKKKKVTKHKQGYVIDNAFVRIAVSDDNIKSLQDSFSVTVVGSDKKYYRIAIKPE